MVKDLIRSVIVSLLCIDQHDITLETTMLIFSRVVAALQAAGPLHRGLEGLLKETLP